MEDSKKLQTWATEEAGLKHESMQSFSKNSSRFDKNKETYAIEKIEYRLQK